MKNVEMRSDKYPYNMATWCEEKSESVVKNLADIVDILRNNKNNMTKNLYEDICDYLHIALIDSTKIYGFSCGVKLDGGEGSKIFEKGNVGLEKVKVLFGKLDKTKGQKKYEELFTFIEVLEELIQGDRTNRTLVHEALWT